MQYENPFALITNMYSSVQRYLVNQNALSSELPKCCMKYYSEYLLLGRSDFEFIFPTTWPKTLNFDLILISYIFLCWNREGFNLGLSQNLPDFNMERYNMLSKILFSYRLFSNDFVEKRRTSFSWFCSFLTNFQ